LQVIPVCAYLYRTQLRQKSANAGAENGSMSGCRQAQETWETGMSQEVAAEAWPSELRLSAEKNALRVSFSDGIAESLTAEMLRVMSPSAEVQGHSPSERKLVGGKREVIIQKIEPVGNYAVKLVFSDGHDTGLFTWPYLRDLARRKDELWDGYIKELAAGGLSRDPA
jgi:DUF971 family protein